MKKRAKIIVDASGKIIKGRMPKHRGEMRLDPQTRAAVDAFGQEPCAACGKPFTEHDGISRTCAALVASRQEVERLRMIIAEAQRRLGRSHAGIQSREAIRMMLEGR